MELCLAWRPSYLALLDVASSPARSNIVRMRECLLDELERRDRDGFTLSLDTAGGPASHQGHRRRTCARPGYGYSTWDGALT